MIKELKLDGLNKKYTIDDFGNIYDIELQRYKKQYENKKGYMKVHLYINGKDKGFFVHRLVLMTFNPIANMENLQVNHIDGNKKNNNVKNLEWCTNAENQRHAFQYGLISRAGTKNSQAKLNEEEVVKIADMIMDGVTHKEIAKHFNISSITVSAIRSKRIWGYLLKDYNFPKSKYSNQK